VYLEELLFTGINADYQGAVGTALCDNGHRVGVCPAPSLASFLKIPVQVYD
jgi:hypothetical protein